MINTFCIFVCTYLAKFLFMGSKIYEIKHPVLLIVKVFDYFRYVPQNIYRYFQ